MIPAWCEPFVGLPFAEHGRDWRGVDCYGLVYLVMGQVFGLILNEWAGLCPLAEAPAVAGTLELARVADNWQRAEGTPRLGDVLVFREHGHPSHVGIVVAPAAGLMLHAMPEIGAVIQSYRSPRWAPRLEYTVRHPKFDGRAPRLARP